MSLTDDEIASQPAVWAQALDRAPDWAPHLAAPGERMLVLGCGTSAFMAQSLARLREAAGLGETHAAYASELPRGRHYDRVLALTRSGTTTEVLTALSDLRRCAPTSVALTAVHGSPVEAVADVTLVLDVADEASVVQTRFPTATLALAMAAFGGPVDGLVDAASAGLAAPLPSAGDARHVVFLGHDWTLGLAHEAALKVREAAQAWSESYPMFDYRHGPIAVADTGSVIWLMGEAPRDLLDDIAATGATVVATDLHPLAQLVHAQRFAVAMAGARGLDPDVPRRLTRSVILVDDGNGPATSDLIGSH